MNEWNVRPRVDEAVRSVQLFIDNADGIVLRVPLFGIMAIVVSKYMLLLESRLRSVRARVLLFLCVCATHMRFIA